MKFRSVNRKITYVVRKQFRVVENGESTTTKGLRAEFTGMPGQGSKFDSEAAQKRLGWTDEDREIVERYLQAHADFGHGLYLIDDAAALDKVLNPTTCLAMYVFDGESHTCGRPCEGDFCPEHAAEYADKEEAIF